MIKPNFNPTTEKEILARAMMLLAEEHAQLGVVLRNVHDLEGAIPLVKELMARGNATSDFIREHLETFAGFLEKNCSCPACKNAEGRPKCSVKADHFAA